MLEIWDEKLGEDKENHKRGGILETRTREGKWKIQSMEAKIEVVGVVKFLKGKEKKRKKLKDRPWKMDT